MNASKRLLYLLLVFSYLLFLGGFNGCVDDYVPSTTTYARVIEVESERTLIVEVIAPTWMDSYYPEDYENVERNDGADGFIHFLYGDIVRVVYAEDNEWIAKAIKNKVDVGAIIGFSVRTSAVSDLSQIPFEVPSTGLYVYEEGDDTVIGQTVVYKGMQQIFGREDY